MRGKWLLMRVLLLGLMLGAVAGLSMAQDAQSEGDAAPQALMGSAFTYQGRLNQGGSPYTGTCDLQFSLYGSAGGTDQIGGTLTRTGVDVADGLFTVPLDFGSGAFTGQACFLQITVRCPTGSGSYTSLSPRQSLTPSPYALALPGLWTQQNDTSPNLIGGYYGNIAGEGVVGATISGGGAEGLYGMGRNRVYDDYAVVGGGAGNIAGTSGAITDNASYAMVGGGLFNTASNQYASVVGGTGNTASGELATVGGGTGNTASGELATVVGGTGNTASGAGAFVGGGGYDGGATDGNEASATAATIGGGYANNASGRYSTVGGGEYNTASGEWDATVGGGRANNASNSYATVGGGQFNSAGNEGATIGGGQWNTASGVNATVGGGRSNNASRESATVGGGKNNTASAKWATVPGGYGNAAEGDFSFAAGRQAKATHPGSFVLADSTAEDFASVRDNSLRARLNGGATFQLNDGYWVRLWRSGTHLIDTSTGAHLTTGGVWTNASAREVKENFGPVDRQQVLARLAAMPIQTWNYRAEGASRRHMGPTSQDFYAAFGLGEDDLHIATVDADGVALAAIQGLYEQNQALAEENATLQEQMDDLEARLAALESRVGAGASSPWRGGRLLPASGLLAVGLGVVWVARRKGGGGR